MENSCWVPSRVLTWRGSWASGRRRRLVQAGRRRLRIHVRLVLRVDRRGRRQARARPSQPGFTNAAALPTACLTSYQSLLGVAQPAGKSSSSARAADAASPRASSRAPRASGSSPSAAPPASLVESRGATVVAYGGGNGRRRYSPGCRFDVVYDAATGSGAGEGYVNLCRETVAPRVDASPSTAARGDQRVDRMAARRR